MSDVRTMRAAVIIIFVLAVILLANTVYREAFVTPRRRLLASVLRERYDGGDNRARGDALRLLRERMDVDADSLPRLRISSTSRPKFDAEENVLVKRRHACLTRGAFVDARNDPVDCRTYCGVSDGVDYRYVDSVDSFVNGSTIALGGYCVSTEAATCNPNTALLLYTGQPAEPWRCIPRSRAFAGEGGNAIVVCDGSLLDRLTGRVWRGYIDPTLKFVSVDETLPSSSDEYRFVCPPSRDRLGNLRVVSPFDRLALVDNYCASVIPYAADDKALVDFQRARCACEPPLREDPYTGYCVPFAREFEASTYATVARVATCVEPWSLYSMYSPDDLASRKVVPCGAAADERPIGGDPACVRERVFIYDRLVPSPYAMRDADFD